MNLIDQKLKDKLKLFEDIDKQLETGYSKNITKVSKTSKTSTKPSKTKSDQFDQIYCNFILNQYKPKESQTLKTPPTSAKSKSKKQVIKSHSPSVSVSRSKSKDLSPPNDSGERLYNYGFYIKNKLQKKRIEEEEKLHRQMTPKILPRSKSIYRDSAHFEDRLYYQSHNASKVNNESTDSNIYKKRATSKENVKFNYKPTLDKKSIKIANRLEPSSQRLLKKKKRIKVDNSPKNNSFYSISPCSASNSHKSKNIIKKCNELYSKGVENMHKREIMYKKQKLKENEEYKNYSFKPKITKNSPLLDNSVVKTTPKSRTSNNTSGNINEEIYKKQFEWKKKVENENIKKKEKIENIKQKEYTFKPEISHLNIQNDEKFIMRNIDQMNDYVNKRREILQKKKEYEDYKNKRLGLNRNFQIKPTIPKEFEFKTQNRSHSRSKSNSKKNFRENNITVNQKREELKTFGYFNDGNYLNNNNIVVNRSGNDQEDFIKAVNEFHYRIDNLNI